MEKATRTNGSIQDLTDEEGRALFDNAARFYLGISGEEFVERWDSGYYDEDPDRPDVVDVAMLLPFALEDSPSPKLRTNPPNRRWRSLAVRDE